MFGERDSNERSTIAQKEAFVKPLAVIFRLNRAKIYFLALPNPCKVRIRSSFFPKPNVISL